MRKKGRPTLLFPAGRPEYLFKCVKTTTQKLKNSRARFSLPPIAGTKGACRFYNCSCGGAFYVPENFQPCYAIFKTKQSIHPSPDELHNSLRRPPTLHSSRARSLLCEIRYKIPRVQRRRRRKKKPRRRLWKMELRTDTAKGHRLKYTVYGMLREVFFFLGGGLAGYDVQKKLA